MLTSSVWFSELNSSKDNWVKSIRFLNSTLISKILLRKLDRKRAKFWQRKVYWSAVSIPAPREYIGLTVSLKLSLNLCLLSRLKLNRRRVCNFKTRGSSKENVKFSLTVLNLVKQFMNLYIELAFLKLSLNLFYSLMQ